MSCLLCPPHGAVHGARTSCTRKGHRETYSALRSMMFGARLPAPEKEKEYMRESGEKKYGTKVEKKIRRKKRKSVLAVPGLCFRSKYVEPIGKATDLWKRIQNLHRLFKPLRCASVHSSHTDKKAKENYNLIFLSTGTVHAGHRDNDSYITTSTKTLASFFR